MNTSKLEHGKKFWGGGKGLWFLLKPLKVNHIPSLGKAAMTAPGLLWDGPKSFIDQSLLSKVESLHMFMIK